MLTDENRPSADSNNNGISFGLHVFVSLEDPRRTRLATLGLPLDTTSSQPQARGALVYTTLRSEPSLRQVLSLHLRSVPEGPASARLHFPRT